MNTRKILILALCVLCLFSVACKKDNGPTGSEPQSTGENAASKFADLPAVVDSVKGFYDETVEFIYMNDEFSDEVLMFTYGLMDDKFVDAVDDFVLTECDGMSADTFAIVRFKAGTDKALIKEAADIMEEEYVGGLKNKLAAYNPEEFAASDGFYTEIFDNAVMMVISSDNADKIVDAVK